MLVPYVQFCLMKQNTDEIGRVLAAYPDVGFTLRGYRAMKRDLASCATLPTTERQLIVDLVVRLVRDLAEAELRDMRASD